MLNSRPLTSISNDINDMSGQFAEGDLKKLDQVKVLRERWRRVQQASQHFWQRWKTEIVPTWRARNKWRLEGVELKEGDLVWLLDDEKERKRWPVGRIKEMSRGSDGKARVFTITKDGREFKRNVTKVCPLEIIDPLKSQEGGNVLEKLI